MFRGKKTTTFYVGLVALGFGIYYLTYLIYQVISVFFLRAFDSAFISASLLGSTIPALSSTVIFLVIGLYVMSKGIEKQPTSS